MKAINAKQERAISVKKFFFPFAPIKTFMSARLLFLLALLIALRIVFSFISIPIAPFSLSISIGWIAVMVLGWYFGPVVGLFGGIITDTLTFFIHGGVWFWLYAIQEPIVGCVAGLIGSFYRYRKQKENKHIMTDLVISQIVVLLFAVTTYVIIVIWLNPNTHFQGSDAQYSLFYSIYKWVALSLILVFMVIYEVIFGLNVKNKISNKKFNQTLIFTYTSSCVVFLILLFSFALGPLTAVEYFKFINGGLTPESFLKYGSMFYLIPRVALESIKVPIEITAFFGVVCLFDKKIISLINKSNSSWEAK